MKGKEGNSKGKDGEKCVWVGLCVDNHVREIVESTRRWFWRQKGVVKKWPCKCADMIETSKNIFACRAYRARHHTNHISKIMSIRFLELLLIGPSPKLLFSRYILIFLTETTCFGVIFYFLSWPLNRLQCSLAVPSTFSRPMDFIRPIDILTVPSIFNSPFLYFLTVGLQGNCKYNLPLPPLLQDFLTGGGTHINFLTIKISLMNVRNNLNL